MTAVAVPRPRGRRLVFAMLILASAVVLKSGPIDHPYRAPQHIAITLPKLAPPAPPKPSVFDLESQLGPRALLDRWDPIMEAAARRFHVPKSWIRAVMQRESGGRTMLAEGQKMISPAGALGLMQVMPDTYAQMRQQYDLGTDPFNAHDNIFAGAAYLRWLHKKYGYPAMFAAYNAGPGRLEDHLAHGKKLPAETRAYISGITKVLGHPAKIRVASSVHYAKLTRPDGKTVRIDPGEVTGIRAPLPGEYADNVKTVVSIGKRQQALREDVASATQAILKAG
jgi:hypothetical protein